LSDVAPLYLLNPAFLTPADGVSPDPQNPGLTTATEMYVHDQRLGAKKHAELKEQC